MTQRRQESAPNSHKCKLRELPGGRSTHRNLKPFECFNVHSFLRVLNEILRAPHGVRVPGTGRVEADAGETESVPSESVLTRHGIDVNIPPVLQLISTRGRQDIQGPRTPWYCVRVGMGTKRKSRYQEIRRYASLTRSVVRVTVSNLYLRERETPGHYCKKLYQEFRKTHVHESS